MVLLGLFFLQASVASAVTLKVGSYYAKYDNLEGFFDPTTGALVSQISVGDVNKGIFRISDIKTNIAGKAWYQDSDSVELTGYFTDIVVQSITLNSAGKYTVNSSGGILSLYMDDTPDWDGTVANATNGTLMVQFAFTWGILPLDTSITVNGELTDLTNPLQGSAYAFLSVIAGSGPWADYFNGDAVPIPTPYPAGTDALLQSNFTENTGSDAVHPELWSLASTDPIRGTIVPEPGTVLLMGIGLIGLAGLGRKKMVRK